ncbi:MAG: hypothetical protein HYZ63_01635 [Candidatus Andersenbacteria bacterium]|nr:hypothetical protein [Candidatus Andersenbacteria bacterium]
MIINKKTILIQALLFLAGFFLGGVVFVVLMYFGLFLLNPVEGDGVLNNLLGNQGTLAYVLLFAYPALVVILFIALGFYLIYKRRLWGLGLGVATSFLAPFIVAGVGSFIYSFFIYSPPI